MAKIWKDGNPVPWICDKDEQDFFASIGDYRLRVERMNTKSWWRQVTYLGDPIPTELKEHCSLKFQAIGLAEGVYLGHKASLLYQQSLRTEFKFNSYVK